MNVLNEAHGNDWSLYHADSCEVLAALLDQSIHLSIFSPPFSSLYTYSPSERDLGNVRTHEEFWQHFGWVSEQLRRVMVPGRNVCVHVANITRTKASHGYIGIYDFRGDTIREFERAGFIYHGEAFIRKNPQASAVRTHAKGLLFVQFEKDAVHSRPAIADYFLLFKTPGDNPVPVVPEATREEWIDWAGGDWPGYDDPHALYWPDIEESETLNVREARENADDRHICPLQLTPIERCVRLYSNRGETVLSPFAGIGSEGFVAVKQGRRFVGVELKGSYWKTAVRNLERAENEAHRPDLFTWQEAEAAQ